MVLDFLPVITSILLILVFINMYKDSTRRKLAQNNIRALGDIIVDFEDQIDLMNEGMRLAKLLEKPGSDILEGLRKVKTSRFVDDNLDKDPDEDEDFILTQLDMDEDDNDEEEYEPDVDEEEDENPEPLEDEEEDTPVFDEEDDDDVSNLTPEQIEKMLPPILRKVIEKGKKVTVSSQPSTSSITKEITKFLDEQFDTYLPAIQKIRGYKNIETKEDFLNLPQEKQESIIKKVCKS
jgi:hypothetical protein